jgi:hypothetical protein
VGITAALLFAGRYFVVRWAVTPLLHPTDRWLFATVATTLIGWPGLWLARFSPAQFSTIFFFLALGFGIRVARRPGFARATGVALSIVAMLMIYQALAIAALAIPLLAFLWVPPGQGDLVADRMRRAIWAGLGLTAGAVAYAIYAVVAYKASGEVYEAGLLGSVSSASYSWVLTNISQAYLTAFVDNKTLLPCFVFLLAVLIPFDDPQIPFRNAFRAILAPLAALLTLPVLALVYVSIFHLRDPERVLFPVTIGFCFVVLLSYAAQQRSNIAPTMRRCGFVVIGLLCSSAVSAYEVRKTWEFQEDVIFQVQGIIRSTGSNSILIEDHTGQLGDVYSFLESSLADALAVYGTPARVRICTPSGVDRIHPLARRYPVRTTQRCEATEADSDGVLVVRATLAEGAIHIER